MNLTELKRLVDRAHSMARQPDDIQVVVPIKVPSMGGQACVPVTQACKGIDWDARKFMLWTDPPVIPVEEPKL